MRSMFAQDIGKPPRLGQKSLGIVLYFQPRHIYRRFVHFSSNHEPGRGR